MSHRKKQEMKKNGEWAAVRGIRQVRNAFNGLMELPSLYKKGKEFLNLYNEAKGNTEDHLKYSADPIVKTLYPLYKEFMDNKEKLIYGKHPRQVVENGLMFVLFVSSQDSAYRHIRNWALDYITKPEIIEKLRNALNEEKQVFDFTNPEKWYDNMKNKALEIDKIKHEKGLLKDNEMSAEKAQFVDQLDWDKFHRKIKNKEV